MNDHTLIREYRGNLLECSHRGYICGVNDTRSIIYHVGDPTFKAYLRSAGRPFQAIHSVTMGLIEEYQLTSEEIALIVSSHRGEHFHQAALHQLAEKLGIPHAMLHCSSSYPLNEEAKIKALVTQQAKQKLNHNCSGKHLGILAYCSMMGYPLQGYERLSHPAQQDIHACMEIFFECAIQPIDIGIDGCGFPVAAISLQHIAFAYLKLAVPSLVSNHIQRSAVIKIVNAMHEAPLMVGGSGRIDSILLEDENIVAKGGFKGIFAFALKKEKLGFAFKVLDGSDEEWGLIVLEILEQIHYDNQKTLVQLKQVASSHILNDSSDIVGKYEAAFQLE